LFNQELKVGLGLGVTRKDDRPAMPVPGASTIRFFSEYELNFDLFVFGLATTDTDTGTGIAGGFAYLLRLDRHL
jgi:hypothetical protein